MDFLIGTLADRGGSGIGRVRLEADRLRLLWMDDSLYDPHWQSISPDGRIFSISSDWPDSLNGCVSQIQVTEQGMQVVSRQAAQGIAPCALDFSADGRFLLCANYETGSLGVFPVEANGLGPCMQLIRHQGHGPHPTRQAEPHVHQVTAIPTLPHRFCVVDLGIDALVVYRQAADGLLSECYRISVPAGQGPRHVAYTPDGSAYLITELGNRVYPVTFGENEGHVQEPGVSTLMDDQTPSAAAALWASPDGKWLYASNRGEGTIARFALPSLQREASYRLMGMEPRDFCLLDEHLILAACQDAGLTLLRDGQIVDTLPFPGAVRVVKL